MTARFAAAGDEPGFLAVAAVLVAALAFGWIGGPVLFHILQGVNP